MANPVVPRMALSLGAAGALPFMALAGAVLFAETGQTGTLRAALVLYGAVILSFLGGVRWGFACAGDKDPEPAQLVLSIVPSLVGWAAALLSPPRDLWVLTAAFVALAVLDQRASDRGEAPAWYPRLRWPLTIVVASCLAAVALRPVP